MTRDDRGVGLVVADRRRVHGEPRKMVRAAQGEGPAHTLGAEAREGPGDEPDEGVLIGPDPGCEPTALIEERIGFAKDVSSPVVRGHDAPPPIELQDPGSGLVEEPCERRAERRGIGECLAHAHVLAKVRQQRLNAIDLSRRPAGSVDRIGERADDPSPVRSVHPHAEAVLRV